MSTPEYLAHVGNRLSPWSKRCLGEALVFRRWACESLSPGGPRQSTSSRFLFAAIGDAPVEHEDEFNLWYDREHIPLLAGVPGVISARRFKDPAANPRYVALYELADASAPERPQWQAALETPWFKRIDEMIADCEWILRLYEAYPGTGDRY